MSRPDGGFARKLYDQIAASVRHLSSVSGPDVALAAVGDAFEDRQALFTSKALANVSTAALMAEVRRRGSEPVRPEKAVEIPELGFAVRPSRSEVEWRGAVRRVSSARALQVLALLGKAYPHGLGADAIAGALDISRQSVRVYVSWARQHIGPIVNSSPTSPARGAYWLALRPEDDAVPEQVVDSGRSPSVVDLNLARAKRAVKTAVQHTA